MDFKLVHLVDPEHVGRIRTPGPVEAYTLDFALFMEPRRRNIEIVRFWETDDQRRRVRLREAPVYDLTAATPRSEARRREAEEALKVAAPSPPSPRTRPSSSCSTTRRASRRYAQARPAPPRLAPPRHPLGWHAAALPTSNLRSTEQGCRAKRLFSGRLCGIAVTLAAVAPPERLRSELERLRDRGLTFKQAWPAAVSRALRDEPMRTKLFWRQAWLQQRAPGWSPTAACPGRLTGAAAGEDRDPRARSVRVHRPADRLAPVPALGQGTRRATLGPVLGEGA